MRAVALLLALVRWPVAVACRIAFWSATRLQSWSSSMYAVQLRLTDGRNNALEEHIAANPREGGWPGFRNVSDDAEV